MIKNFFITFEGIDGSGKSTQAKLLVDKYDVMGLETEITITEISDITRYRVRYGKFDRIAKAQTAAKFLKDKYNLDSWADNVYK